MTVPRVFGIGLSRTGTTSLSQALEVLGFRTKHYPFPRSFAGRLLGIRPPLLEQYDAFTDISVIPFYKRLDKRFPGSRFILTERDLDEWLDSCRTFPRFRSGFEPNDVVLAVRRAVYGIESFDVDLFRAAHLAHVADVERHFRDRPGDLLRMDICAGDGWEPLCTFLDRPVPDAPFPRLNARSERA